MATPIGEAVVGRVAPGMLKANLDLSSQILLTILLGLWSKSCDRVILVEKLRGTSNKQLSRTAGL